MEEGFWIENVSEITNKRGIPDSTEDENETIKPYKQYIFIMLTPAQAITGLDLFQFY